MKIILLAIWHKVFKSVEAWIIWVFFVSLVSNNLVFAQSQRVITEEQIAYGKKKIKELKQGALLVRLTNPKSKGADSETAKDNIDIIKAFNKKFDFCPVYFFYAEDSRFVINKQFSSVRFINSKGKVDSRIAFNKKYFLTAEFQGVDVNRLKKNLADTSLIKTYSYRMKYYSLVVKSEKFEQMQMPFPYFIRNPKNPSNNRRFEKTIAKLSNKFHRYHFIAVSKKEEAKDQKSTEKAPIMGWFPFILLQPKFDLGQEG